MYYPTLIIYHTNLEFCTTPHPIQSLGPKFPCFDHPTPINVSIRPIGNGASIPGKGATKFTNVPTHYPLIHSNHLLVNLLFSMSVSMNTTQLLNPPQTHPPYCLFPHRCLLTAQKKRNTASFSSSGCPRWSHGGQPTTSPCTCCGGPGTR